MIDFQKEIDNFLAKKQEEKKDRISSNRWNPSSFGRCLRMQVWKRRGEPESNPPDERTLRVFKAGFLFEEFALSCIKGIDKQVRIETDDVVGYADATDADTVYDVKSQHSKSFWYMKKFAKRDVAHQKYCNWLQVMTYAMELDKCYSSLVFISKDDLCIKQFILPYDSTWERCIMKELRMLNKWWANGKLPEAKPRAFNGNECAKFCSYRDRCKKEGD